MYHRYATLLKLTIAIRRTTQRKTLNNTAKRFWLGLELLTPTSRNHILGLVSARTTSWALVVSSSISFFFRSGISVHLRWTSKCQKRFHTRTQRRTRTAFETWSKTDHILNKRIGFHLNSNMSSTCRRHRGSAAVGHSTSQPAPSPPPLILSSYFSPPLSQFKKFSEGRACLIS